MQTSEKIGIIGLGYVGMPLAMAFSRHHDVIGFDTNTARIDALKNGVDWTNEVSPEDLAGSSMVVTDDVERLRDRDVVIVTVPTPIDDSCRPDFSYLLNACAAVGKVISPGTIIVFESTVYPGATEEICAVALEEASGLRGGIDFKLGYSPERINPGDKDNRIETIIKVVAAQDAETLDRLSELYGSIITAGIHRASSIKVAEAAKVIENTQRDVNIALMNELSKICDHVGIRTSEVLEAAGTKWNFLKFYPGLVGGHCIGVDPYYLTAKAEQLGYHPEVILSGRRINDGMGAYIAQRAVKLLALADRSVRYSQVGILGLAFKENVPDIRNSKVADIYKELSSFCIEPLIHDPFADPAVAQREYGIKLSEIEAFAELDLLIFAVSHSEYDRMGIDRIQAMIAKGGILVDVKSSIDPLQLRPDIKYWSL